MTGLPSSVWQAREGYIMANETVLKTGFTTFVNVDNVTAAILVANEFLPLIGDKRANAAKKSMGTNGHAVLTNERFVFGKGKSLKKMSAGDVADFSDALAKGDIDFDITLGEMISVTQGKQGLSVLLNIETGEGVFKFAFMKKAVFAEWEDALNSARAKL